MPNPDQMRAKYRGIVHKFRHIAGDHGLRPHSVTIVVGSWSGWYPGEGSEIRSETPLLENGQNPKVRWLKQDEIAIGNLPRGTAIIGPITPDFPGGGVAIDTITQDTTMSRGNTYLVKIVGPQHPDGAWYRRVSTDASKALHYTITVVPAEPVDP